MAKKGSNGSGAGSTQEVAAGSGLVADSGRVMKAIGNATGENKPLVILRPSKLAEEGRTGLIAAGIYMGGTPNKFKPENSDFRINGDTEDFILNSSTTLNSKLSEVDVGTYVEVTYTGMLKSKKGKDYHNFEVLVEVIEN